jgi:hypothetical protein
LVLGFNITASPESSRWTFQLANAQLVTPFVLDEAFFGVLDQNKLGF